jgi:hypothetical protein
LNKILTLLFALFLVFSFTVSPAMANNTTNDSAVDIEQEDDFDIVEVITDLIIPPANDDNKEPIDNSTDETTDTNISEDEPVKDNSQDNEAPIINNTVNETFELDFKGNVSEVLPKSDKKEDTNVEDKKEETKHDNKVLFPDKHNNNPDTTNKPSVSNDNPPEQEKQSEYNDEVETLENKGDYGVSYGIGYGINLNFI